MLNVYAATVRGSGSAMTLHLRQAPLLKAPATQGRPDTTIRRISALAEVGSELLQRPVLSKLSDHRHLAANWLAHGLLRCLSELSNPALNSPCSTEAAAVARQGQAGEGSITRRLVHLDCLRFRTSAHLSGH